MLILLLLLSVFCKKENDLFVHKPEVNMLVLEDFKNIQSFINPKMFNLLFIYDKSEESSIEMADIIKEIIHPKFHNFYNLIAIGCHHKLNQVPELPICSGDAKMPSLPVVSGMRLDPDD